MSTPPKRTAKRPPALPVQTTKLSIRALVPEARKEALRLAQGDATRIEVVSTTEAIVR